MTTTDHDVANLKLQMAALRQSAQAASLPEAVANMRSTIRWSATVIAAALVVSSALRLVADAEVQDLRRRVERLERERDVKALPFLRRM